MEKPGIEPATPGLEGFSSFCWICFCGRVPWLNQYWPGDFLVFVVLCPGTPEGSTGSGSGFKASQKTGPRFKVSSDRLLPPGIEPATPFETAKKAHASRDASLLFRSFVK